MHCHSHNTTLQRAPESFQGAARRRAFFVPVLLLAICVEAAWRVRASDAIASAPAGFRRLTLTAGANFISSPLQPFAAWRGIAAEVRADGWTASGDPGWATDSFAARDGYIQYIALVRKSAPGAESEGHWWPITGNGGGAVTVDTRGDDLATILAPGSRMEIRRLCSIRDLFGAGAGCVLNKDSNGIPSNTQEDVIRFLSGTGFSSAIFYHDGGVAAEGYYAGGRGPFDGSTITIWPDQPLLVLRKAGSAPVEIFSRGQVQITRLAHYLQPGANAVASPFALTAPVESAGLLESGWLSDVNGIPSASQEDLLRPVTGLSLGPPVFHHNGIEAAAGWYSQGRLNNQFGLEPGRGYIFYIQGNERFVWRQFVPPGH